MPVKPSNASVHRTCLRAFAGYKTLTLLALCTIACGSPESKAIPYRNPKLSIDARAEDLLGRMTPADRNAVSRGANAASLDIPALTGTQFPRGRAIAATWDTDLAGRQAQAFARAQLAAGHREVKLPPMDDFGGDPWLTSRMTVAMVSGLQGEGVIAALPDFGPAYKDADERTRNELILSPFRAAVEEAGAWSIDTAADVPEEWGFKGFTHRPDEDIHRRLRAMVAAGFFDPPPQPEPEAAHDRLTDESVVLLKNETGVLPLSPTLGSIALIGMRLPEMPPQAVYASGKSIEEAAGLAQRSVAAVVFSDNPELIRAVAERNRNTVVVSDGSSPAEIGKWIDRVPAALISWGSNDIGHILFGEVSPSGKLPFALGRSDSKFPFGFGLSYTTFGYTDLLVSPKTPRYGQLIQVSVRVANTGTHTGAEVVQLYLHPENANGPRPLTELKAFRRIELKPGESRIVSFELDRRALTFYDPLVHDWAITPGVFDVLAGSSSRDIRLRGSFELFR